MKPPLKLPWKNLPGRQGKNKTQQELPHRRQAKTNKIKGQGLFGSTATPRDHLYFYPDHPTT
jgi:hypothetical protein